MNDYDYDRLVALTAEATKTAEALLPDWLLATGRPRPSRYETLEHIEFKALARPGGSPEFDIEFTYRDYERDTTTYYLPAKALWDLEGALADDVVRREAVKARQDAMEAVAAYERGVNIEANERATLKRLREKYPDAD